MRCDNCRFYGPFAGHEWKGACRIKLPPHIEEAASNYSSLTRGDNGCDLGQPKEDKPGELVEVKV